MSATSSKSAVVAATDNLFGQHDGAAVDRSFSPAYIQHNPGFPNGLEPLRGLAGMKALKYERARVIAEGDLVVTHSVYTGFGPAPMAAFDVFRVENGKIVEHWDVLQPVVAKTVSGRSQVDGPTEVVDLDKTAANKALIQGFLDDVLYAHKMDKLTTYFSTEQYDQHNPGVGDGLAGFGKAMSELQAAGLTMEYQKTYRVVAEGNFVFTHSEGIFAGKHVAFADLFRVAGGKIVEHWDTIQEIPAKTASGNSMF
jgi:predicted SnoaL-like aldol condensation-catalyzing enzyme